MTNRHIFIYILFIWTFYSCKNENIYRVPVTGSKEQHRPEFHFTPDSMWMNDPNGMVYFDGEYHLFYQYFPDSIVWGPMHWGHAVSKDMIRWQQLPIALYPDSLGYIFSGSAVIDWKNTSGFGKDGSPPMVAIFTHHNIAGEKAGRSDFQYQSIAYSLDKGRSWTKYADNPVVPNPGNIKDFRDPKVIWHEDSHKWIMVLAARDKVKLYSSPDLKKWSFESDFGIKNDARLWECPDLFPLKVEGNEEPKWVLIVSMQSGAPNKGTGTSYFIGYFDGHTFTCLDQKKSQHWLDYGTDNYAMVSWSDIPSSDGRRLALGWMSNWLYAQKVPTGSWRSAMTLPRELSIIKTETGKYLLKSNIIREFYSYRKDTIIINPSSISSDQYRLPLDQNGLYEINISFARSEDLSFLLTSEHGDTLQVGYEAKTDIWFIDRSKAGKSDFFEGFAAKHSAPCISESDTISMQIILDKASLELIADGGLTNMTDIFFPGSDMTQVFLITQRGSKSVSDIVTHHIRHPE
jgi:fructan beta-fructosidase